MQRALVGQLGDERVDGPRRRRIDHQSSRRHAVEQLAHVVAHVGAAVALRQRAGDVVERALAVAQLEHLGGGGVEPHRALGDEQQVLLAHVVVAQPRAGDQARARHALAPAGCVSPRSIASSCAHSISVLKRSAATARVLLLGRAAALDGEVERVLRVARRLNQPRAEVVQAGGVDPRVVALERVEPHADRAGPEELGER